MASPLQIESLLLRAHSLLTEILRVRNEERPFSETEVVYDALIEVLDSRSALVEDSLKVAFPDAVSMSDYVLRTVGRDLELILKLLGYLERVDSPRIPFEVIKSLSWVASDLFREKSYIAVRLDSDYTYSIFSYQRELEINGWGEYWRMAIDKWHIDHPNRPDDTPPTVWLLRLPSPDADSTLLHALAAHEFGHEFAYRFRANLEDITQQVASDLMKEHVVHMQDHIAELVTTKGKANGEYSTNDIASEVLDRFNKIIRNWMEEIFADLTAIRLVGPAFLAAFDRIVTGSAMASDYHPPTWLRRSISRGYLSTLLPAISSDPIWSSVISEHKELETSSDSLYQIAEQFRFLVARLDPLLNQIPCPLARLAPTDLAGIVSTAEEYIENLAPPSVPLQSLSEFAGAERFWVLMYVGWHYRLSPRFNMMEERCGLGREANRSEEVLGNLLVHAFQSIELGARWSQGRANGEQRVT
jgi:hypothetical protein